MLLLMFVMPGEVAGAPSKSRQILDTAIITHPAVCAGDEVQAVPRSSRAEAPSAPARTGRWPGRRSIPSTHQVRHTLAVQRCRGGRGAHQQSGHRDVGVGAQPAAQVQPSRCPTEVQLVGERQERLQVSGLHDLASASPDLLRQMLTTFINTLMSAEADAICGAPYGQVSPERSNVRNGYRHRDFDTRAGTLDLAIPKLREGSYFPDWLLERRRRSERALTSVVATCYLLGVSTRRMEKLVETLAITRLSKSQVSVMATELDTAVEAFRTTPSLSTTGFRRVGSVQELQYVVDDDGDLDGLEPGEGADPGRDGGADAVGERDEVLPVADREGELDRRAGAAHPGDRLKAAVAVRGRRRVLGQGGTNSRDALGDAPGQDGDDPPGDAGDAQRRGQESVARVLAGGPDRGHDVLEDPVGHLDVLVGEVLDRRPEPLVLGQRGLAVRAAALVGRPAVGVAVGDLGDQVIDGPSAR